MCVTKNGLVFFCSRRPCFGGNMVVELTIPGVARCVWCTVSPVFVLFDDDFDVFCLFILVLVVRSCSSC